MPEPRTTRFRSLRPVVKRVPPLRWTYLTFARLRSELKILKYSLDSRLLSDSIRRRRNAPESKGQSIPLIQPRCQSAETLMKC